MFCKYNYCSVIIFLANLHLYSFSKLDLLNCGIDHDEKVSQGKVPLRKYPWVGVLYYAYMPDGQETRSVTTVVLIHRNFVVGSAADIGPMPKNNFRRNSRVLLGASWTNHGRRVRNYVLHPEYGETLNTLALVHLKDTAPYGLMKPLCPPPDKLRDPIFYVVKFESDYNELQKEVIPVGHVPSDLCRDFYIQANLYQAKHRPPHVVCAVALDEEAPCVWAAGGPLVARDIWGRWQFLGLGVRGPGCGAPARFLDMGTYYPWIESALAKFAAFTISKIHQHKYVLRFGGSGPKEDDPDTQVVRYGDCDREERLTLQYREMMLLETDNKRFQFLTYNLTIRDTIRFDCLTLELTNASAATEIKLVHVCPQKPEKSYQEKYERYLQREACHVYMASAFDISVLIMYSGSCMFQLYAWGENVDMELLDIQTWKWEEGTYYEDFNVKDVEYRGQSYMTDFGFEPLDLKMWIPDYDSWTTEYVDNSTRTTFEPGVENATFFFKASTTTLSTSTTSRTKRYFRTKNRTTIRTTKKP